MLINNYEKDTALRDTVIEPLVIKWLKIKLLSGLGLDREDALVSSSIRVKAETMTTTKVSRPDIHKALRDAGFQPVGNHYERGHDRAVVERNGGWEVELANGTVAYGFGVAPLKATVNR